MLQPYRKFEGSMGTGRAATASRPKVFVSYSRKDAEFA